MRARVVVLLLLLLGAIAPVAARAAVPSSAPTPEPNAAGTVLPPRPCTAEQNNPYEAAIYQQEGWKAPNLERYPGACQRLKFSFGPILVKPGQNDVLVQPVTIEKPLQDGYITRFRPDLVRQDGTVPPIEEVHLHHGTWLSNPNYGSGPFFAAGEEKTIGDFPRGYGLPIRGSDQWLLLYMIHSAVAKPDVVYITYEIDFVPRQAAENKLKLRPAYPIWLDVRPASYPVFNVQRGFGAQGACQWPKDQCASFDPWGKSFIGQGLPGNGRGTDWRFPRKGGRVGAMTNFQGGTLIAIGGHVHPGGLNNNIDLVRDDRAQRIYTSEAKYWDRADPTKTGGPPTSWDFSMTVTGLPRWGIRIKPGDALRSNATYESTIQSTYENMGIAVAMFAPDLPNGKHTAPGLDPFAAPFDPSPSCASGGLAKGALCDKGVVTHGHMREASNFGKPQGTLPTRLSGPVSQVEIAGFLYSQGDLSRVATTGIPTVRLGQKLQFLNADAAAGVYHTITSCAYPCTGPTGISFPLADGRSSAGRPLDFDSAELGYGIPELTAVKNEGSWTIDVTPAAGFAPGSILTYYCRIHPFMRGAVAVEK